MTVTKSLHAGLLAVALLAASVRGQDTSRVMPQEVLNARWILNIPEFHDSQRFRNGGKYFGPYVRGFAQPGLDRLTLDTFREWQLVAVVLVDTWTDPVTPFYAVTGTSTIFSTIGPTRHVPQWPAYQGLNILSTWNCVFLRHPTGSPTSGWEAIIGPVHSVGVGVGVDREPPRPTCVPRPRADPAGVKLFVVTEAPSARPDAYPPVVRFVSIDNETYALGVRCAAAWCNIMPKGATTVPASALATMPGLPTAAQWNVKGWFDDQELAAPMIEGRSSALAPTMRAAIVPDPLLGGITFAQLRGAMTHVATIYIPPSSPIPPNYQKWGFEHGRNEISIQLNDAVFGNGVLITPSNKRIILTVHRHSHKEDMPPGFRMAATARWVFLDDDDAVWVACDEGCCYIDPSRS